MIEKVREHTRNTYCIFIVVMIIIQDYTEHFLCLKHVIECFKMKLEHSTV